MQVSFHPKGQHTNLLTGGKISIIFDRNSKIKEWNNEKTIIKFSFETKKQKQNSSYA